jgi:hypothetical protein
MEVTMNKKNSPFVIKPESNYKIPSYPTPKSKNDRTKSTSFLWFSAAIALGTAGCTNAIEALDNNNIIDGGIQECYPEDLICNENGEVGTCVEEDGLLHYQWQDCSSYCLDKFGSEYYPWGQCSLEDQENLCQCEYDIIDGGIGLCMEDDFYCGEDSTINVCNDSSTDYENITCSDWCTVEFGEGFVPRGDGCIDSDTNNPCGCDYDMMDGFAGECTLDNLICVSDTVVGICDENQEYKYFRCDELCKDEFGYEYSSTGCDNDPENPCKCEIPEK